MHLLVAEARGVCCASCGLPQWGLLWQAAGDMYHTLCSRWNMAGRQRAAVLSVSLAVGWLTSALESHPEWRGCTQVGRTCMHVCRLSICHAKVLAGMAPQLTPHSSSAWRGGQGIVSALLMWKQHLFSDHIVLLQHTYK